jgi:hypothetical protein
MQVNLVEPELEGLVPKSSWSRRGFYPSIYKKIAAIARKQHTTLAQVIVERFAGV